MPESSLTNNPKVVRNTMVLLALPGPTTTCCALGKRPLARASGARVHVSVHVNRHVSERVSAYRAGAPSAYDLRRTAFEHALNVRGQTSDAHLRHGHGRFGDQ